jgi:hypothetical protein
MLAAGRTSHFCKRSQSCHVCSAQRRLQQPRQHGCQCRRPHAENDAQPCERLYACRCTKAPSLGLVLRWISCSKLHCSDLHCSLRLGECSTASTSQEQTCCALSPDSDASRLGMTWSTAPPPPLNRMPNAPPAACVEHQTTADMCGTEYTGVKLIGICPVRGIPEHHPC